MNCHGRVKMCFCNESDSVTLYKHVLWLNVMHFFTLMIWYHYRKIFLGTQPLAFCLVPVSNVRNARLSNGVNLIETQLKTVFPRAFIVQLCITVVKIQLYTEQKTWEHLQSLSNPVPWLPSSPSRYIISHSCRRLRPPVLIFIIYFDYWPC